MNGIDTFFHTQPPTALRPLLGQTVLAVEDSRFACEAVRLVCLRSGARIRRADCLKSARKHLKVYRPSVLLVDMGLPDGTGAELIAELADASPRIAVILAISGDPSLEDAAIQSGADAFLAKPLQSLAAFQAQVLAHLPRDQQPKGPRALGSDEISPDAVAFQDDLAHAREALVTGAAGYVAQFVLGIARCAADSGLAGAAERLGCAPENPEAVARMEAILQDRLGQRMAI